MISEAKVRELIAEGIEGTDIYLVDLQISADNRIDILVDADEGLSIEKCMKVSRAVEHNLDREEADFALNVSSPGLDRPFMVVRQYENNVGRNLKVTFNDESRKGLEGMLIQADEEGIVLETSEKVRIEGKKKKELVVTEHPVPYTEIKAAKVVISFK